jgi:hypothetical protein
MVSAAGVLRCGREQSVWQKVEKVQKVMDK